MWAVARYFMYGCLGSIMTLNGLYTNELGFWAILICVTTIDVSVRFIERQQLNCKGEDE